MFSGFSCIRGGNVPRTAMSGQGCPGYNSTGLRRTYQPCLPRGEVPLVPRGAWNERTDIGAHSRHVGFVECSLRDKFNRNRSPDFYLRSVRGQGFKAPLFQIRYRNLL